MMTRCPLWLLMWSVLCAPAMADTIDPESRLNEARILIDAGQTESAREMLGGYLSAGGAQMDYAEYLMTMTRFSDTDPDAPRYAVESFQRRYPDSKFVPMALFRLGQFYRVTMRDAPRATLAYSRFLQYYPQDPMAREAYLWLASVFIDAGPYDRAIATVHQALAIFRYDPQERRILDGLMDFARQSTTNQPTGGVTIDVQPPAGDVRGPDGTEPAPPPLPPVEPAPSPRPQVEPAVSERTEQEAGQTVMMNYRDADIDDVLNSFAEELGLTFIKDEDVQGKITVINPRRMTRTEALHLFESILELKGFAIVRSGKVYKILAAQKSYKQGLEVYPPGKSAPPHDRPVTKLIRLQHTPAQDAARVLRPLLGDAGSLQADLTQNALILTGIASNVARLEAIALALDGAGAEDQHEAFHLKFLSATEALPLVQKLLATSRPENLGSLKLVAGPTPVYLFAVGPADMILKARSVLNLIDVPSFTEESLKVYPLKEANAGKLAGFLETLMAKGPAAPIESAPARPGVVSADRMTNSIVVLGTRAFHDVMAPLIKKLDYEGFAALRVQVVTLKYANATDLAGKFENIAARGLGIDGEAFSNQILIQADARLNALLFASASKSLLQTLSDLAGDLDRPMEDTRPRTEDTRPRKESGVGPINLSPAPPRLK